MSFQKLFKKADEVCGIARPFPLEQADTSAFDEVEEEEPINRIIVADRDVEKLHSTIKRVIIEPIHESVVIKNVSNQNNSIKNEKICAINQKQSIIPDISWDNEIQDIMRNDTSDDNSDMESTSYKNNTKLNTNINALANSLNQSVSIIKTSNNNINNIQSYDCIDNDNGDIDPLDILIPNPTRDAYMNIFPMESMNENTHENNHNNITTKNTDNNTNATNTITTSIINNIEDDDNNDHNNIYMSKSERDKQRKLEKANRIKSVDINFDAASSIERSALLVKPKDHIPFYRNNKLNRTLISSFNHNNIAIQHKNSKADLYEVELKYFHRPRMIRDREKKWSIIPKINKSKLKQSLFNTSTNTTSSSSSSNMKQHIEQDKQNLNLSSSNADFILVEYIEEIPPIILNYGMASAIFNYYRYNNKEEDEDNTTNNDTSGGGNNATTTNTTSNNNTNTTTTTTSTQKQSELTKYRDNILNNKNISRLPRHLLLLLQLNKYNKQIYNHDINIPKLKQGETKLLNMNENSPFLGTLEEGEIQQSLINNLFRAPIFKHTISKTDFLLIKTKNHMNIITYILKEIPIIYICGQIEPLKIVPKPLPLITSIQEKYYILTALRYLNIHFDGCYYNDLEKNILKYCLKEKTTPHKIQHRNKLKIIIKKITDEVKENNNSIKYYPKDFTITNNNPNNSNNNIDNYDLERIYNIDEIIRTFTPEDVCLQEACNAGEYRLFQQYITTDIDIGKIENYLLYIYNIKKKQFDYAEKIKKIMNENKNNNHLNTILNHFLNILIKKMNKMNQKLEVGRFIFNRLIIAPWNTTEAYVHSHIEKDNQGKMNLQGIADPSGIGEGYSYIRIIKQPLQSQQRNNTINKKNTVKYYDTDKDLRKLTKKDAVKLLVALGVRENEAIALKRWDRIHMIREFSTKLEKTGLAKELHKYARSNQNDTQITSNNENFHIIAQDIWNRQKKALSNTNILYETTNTSNTSASSSSSMMEIENNITTGTTTNNEAAEEEESSDDEDFATSIAKTLARRAAASASVEDKLTSSRENKEEEKNELQNISSFFNTLSSNKAAAGSGSSTLDAITNSTSGVVRISKTGENISSIKKPRVHIDINNSSGSSGSGGYSNTAEGAGGGDERASLENRSGFTLSLPITQQQQPTSSNTTATIEKLKKEWIRPKRVVKRTVRTILADGTEHYHIEYVFDDSEVSRVDRLSSKWRQERELRRTATAAGSYNNTTSTSNNMNNNEYLEDTEDILPTTITSMKFNLSRMKKSIDQNNIILKRNNYEQEDDDYEYNTQNHQKKTNKSSKRTHEIIINNRVPRVSLAAKLEEEFIKLWNSKYSTHFRYPVNSIEVPGYYHKITEPICLSDIREKIVTYQYETALEFIADVEKMFKNSEIFNGENHPVTLAGKKLVHMLHINIHHDREYLGIEHDNIVYIEEAIKRKKSYLRKNHVPASEYNPLIQIEK